MTVDDIAIIIIIIMDKAICLSSEEYRHYSYLSRYIASLTVTVGWAIIVFFKIKIEHQLLVR